VSGGSSPRRQAGAAGRGAASSGRLGPARLLRGGADGRLRLFASLREAAGTGSVRSRRDGGGGGRPGHRRLARLLRALATAQTWVNGERAGPATPVYDDDEVALIPPVSGAPRWCAPGRPGADPAGGGDRLALRGNARSPGGSPWRWCSPACCGLRLAGAAGRRGLWVGAVPILLSVTAGLWPPIASATPAWRAATVGAVLLALVWSVLTPTCGRWSRLPSEPCSRRWERSGQALSWSCGSALRRR